MSILRSLALPGIVLGLALSSLGGCSSQDPVGVRIRVDETGAGNCYMVDSQASNTWRALRTLNGTHNTQYIEYDAAFEFKTIQFHEYYDIDTDPYQMKNIYDTLSDAQKKDLEQRIETYWTCQGESCE